MDTVCLDRPDEGGRWKVAWWKGGGGGGGKKNLWPTSVTFGPFSSAPWNGKGEEGGREGEGGGGGGG